MCQSTFKKLDVVPPSRLIKSSKIQEMILNAKHSGVPMSTKLIPEAQQGWILYEHAAYNTNLIQGQQLLIRKRGAINQQSQKRMRTTRTQRAVLCAQADMASGQLSKAEQNAVDRTQDTGRSHGETYLPR